MGPTFADIEQVLIDYFTPRLAVPVSTKKSNALQFVRLFRTGGPMATKVSERAQISIEAFAPTETEASRLLNRARSLIHALAGTSFGGVSFKEVTELGGPVNLPDASSPTHARYTFTPSLHYRTIQSL